VTGALGAKGGGGEEGEGGFERTGPADAAFGAAGAVLRMNQMDQRFDDRRMGENERLVES